MGSPPWQACADAPGAETQRVRLLPAGTTAGQAGVLQRQRSNAAEQATFLFRGQPFSSFERPLPQVVEAQLFRRFHGLYNQSQASRRDASERPPVCCSLGCQFLTHRISLLLRRLLMPRDATPIGRKGNRCGCHRNRARAATRRHQQPAQMSHAMLLHMQCAACSLLPRWRVAQSPASWASSLMLQAAS